MKPLKLSPIADNNNNSNDAAASPKQNLIEKPAVLPICESSLSRYSEEEAVIEQQPDESKQSPNLASSFKIHTKPEDSSIQ